MGVRRFQNPDGSLTSAGQKRYNSGNVRKDMTHKINDTAHANALIEDKLAYQKNLSSSDRKKLEANLAKGKKLVNKYLNEAHKLGYDTIQRNVQYASHTATGKNAIARFLFKGPVVYGSKYRLSKNKNGAGVNKQSYLYESHDRWSGSRKSVDPHARIRGMVEASRNRRG